jgi:hypothetical protein
MSSFGSPTDIATAAKRGAILGAAFAATLGLVMLIRGQAVFAAYQTPFWYIAVIAIGAGLVTGMLLGLLSPLAAHRWGAMILGALAGICGFCAIFFIAFGTYDWHWGSTILAGVLLGAPAGSMFWTDPRRRPPA